MGDCLWANVTSQLGPLNLASLCQVLALTGWGKGGNVTSTGWQVTACNPKWHHVARAVPVAVRLLANCYTPFTSVLEYSTSKILDRRNPTRIRHTGRPNESRLWFVLDHELGGPCLLHIHQVGRPSTPFTYVTLSNRVSASLVGGRSLSTPDSAPRPVVRPQTARRRMSNISVHYSSLQVWVKMQMILLGCKRLLTIPVPRDNKHGTVHHAVIAMFAPLTPTRVVSSKIRLIAAAGHTPPARPGDWGALVQPRLKLNFVNLMPNKPSSGTHFTEFTAFNTSC